MYCCMTCTKTYLLRFYLALNITPEVVYPNHCGAPTYRCNPSGLTHPTLIRDGPPPSFGIDTLPRCLPRRISWLKITTTLRLFDKLQDRGRAIMCACVCTCVCSSVFCVKPLFCLAQRLPAAVRVNSFLCTYVCMYTYCCCCCCCRGPL